MIPCVRRVFISPRIWQERMEQAAAQAFVDTPDRGSHACHADMLMGRGKCRSAPVRPETILRPCTCWSQYCALCVDSMLGSVYRNAQLRQLHFYLTALPRPAALRATTLWHVASACFRSMRYLTNMRSRSPSSAGPVRSPWPPAACLLPLQSTSIHARPRKVNASAARVDAWKPVHAKKECAASEHVALLGSFRTLRSCDPMRSHRSYSCACMQGLTDHHFDYSQLHTCGSQQLRVLLRGGGKPLQHGLQPRQLLPAHQRAAKGCAGTHAGMFASCSVQNTHCF